MVDSVVSKNKKHIRLTDERWLHITDNHTEIAGLKHETLETVMDKILVDTVYDSLPALLSLAKKTAWLDYDKDADVLYVSFRKPQDATETTPMDDHVLLRYHDETLVGITIIGASKLVGRSIKKSN